MKNIFKSLLLAATLMMGTASFAEGTSYLYWMLSEMPADTPVVWNYAMVKVVGSDADESATALAYLTADGSSIQKFGKETIGGYDYIDSTLATVGSQYLTSQYKFIVELFSSGSDDLLACSNAIMGDKIIAGTTTAGLTDNIFGGTHIPEPTSGMLALLGFGLLALRRKRI